jgi:hypothetical protein
MLIKAKIPGGYAYKTRKDVSIPISYNQYYLEEPSDLPILHQIMSNNIFHYGWVYLADI